MSTAVHHIGALSEAMATAFLLRRGYEVFRNVSAHGPIDLVAVHARTGEVRLYDVKTRRSTEGSRLTEEQIRIGVRPLYVEPDIGVVSEQFSEFKKLIATTEVPAPIPKRTPAVKQIPAFLVKSKSDKAGDQAEGATQACS